MDTHQDGSRGIENGGCSGQDGDSGSGSGGVQTGAKASDKEPLSR